MIRFDIITIHPELLTGPFSHSMIKRGVDKGLIEINLVNLRDYATDKHKTVDDTLYGGGPGMIMMVEPVDKCISDLKGQRNYDEVIYMSPDGIPLDQKLCNRLSLNKNLIMICGHYKGIDERIREHLVSMEISIGDYVLTGGELAAAVVIDSVGRLIPGVMSDESSALSDSFQDDLIAPPAYTRPAEYKGWKVPEVLLSGDERKISEWRYEKSLERTRTRRPNLGED